MSKANPQINKHDRKPAFLKARAEKLSISHAARAAGISKQTVYNWREEDPEFARAMDDAKETAIDALEDSMYERAMNGDTIAGIFLLKGHRKHYVDRIQLEHSATPADASTEMQAVFEVLDSMASRQLPNGAPVPQIAAPAAEGGE